MFETTKKNRSPTIRMKFRHLIFSHLPRCHPQVTLWCHDETAVVHLFDNVEIVLQTEQCEKIECSSECLQQCEKIKIN